MKDMDYGNMVITTLKVLGWFIGLAFIGFVSWFAWNSMQYRIKFRIRKITGTHNIIIDDRARIVRLGKTGKSVVKWRLKKMKENIPVPPDGAISIDNRGKMVVEAYSTTQGQYEYIVPNTAVQTLEPLTTDDKSFYAEEYKDSMKYKGMDWSHLLGMITNGVILVTVLVLALIFVNNIIEPADMVANKLVSAIESAKQCQALVPVNAP